ncbi:prepilin-type N-terminal cleavage/methylation domain-containing protein [Nitratiruptor sp. SB155-2]|uniref:prepilin-type N-terminal cleavage/methylation domain-containing protein n=1 Tax=Nitratiruptor sp. (strain SB155-2) TaxID=387092 RepID=UPI000158723B|nr:prepilin-type N-terminal cleavage/methylation domain-containing protein [Nitratiruptor sp. SB155-2]BAF70668.1 fimbrial protein [Nitratiruptor sp. SB155-2]
MRKSFTLIELIFVIVIIGILASVAIPKFKGLTANSKIASELATASTIQSAIEDVHDEWVTNEGSFTWGNGRSSSELTSTGYPIKLGDCPPAFNWILKNSSVVDNKWTCQDNGGGIFTYRGPASQSNSGVAENGAGKPDSNDCWEYNATAGTFNLKENCS